MELHNLFPKPSKFYLRSPKRWFNLDPISLADEIWIADKYGEKISDIFLNQNIQEICRVAFRLLDIEDKKFLKKQDVDSVSEEGELSSIQIGGVDLLYSMISGDGEKIDLINSLVEVFGASRPEPEEEDKKKVKNQSQQIGD